jgi:Kef-type K+ transport system membrane component KefB/Trk K+ transport system NAD-binding subunit
VGGDQQMEETQSFAPLLLVLFLAFAVPILLTRFRKVRLPIVVGEIMAGIIVGRSGLGWVAHHDPVLDLLSEFGFVFLMFLAGMEIDFSSLGALTSPSGENSADARLGPIALGGLNFALTLGLSGLMGFGLQSVGLTQNPLLMALILSTTSLGVVVPVLKERGMSTGRLGQTILIAALIADFATMLLITVDVAILSSGLTLDILLVGILFVAFFLVYRFGDIFFNRIPAVRRVLEELSHATAQIKVRAAFTMMLIFVVLSELVGTEIILGAFLAGAIVALLRTPEDADLSHQLDSIGYGFFIPIFFVMVGVDFNLSALLESPRALALVPLLLILALLVKILPALLFRLNFPWRESLASGALLTARLSLIIAASAIGLRLNVISEASNAAIILVAALTSTLAPLSFNMILPTDEEKRARWVMIYGAANIGVQVAKELQAHGEKVCLLESDTRLVKLVRKEGFEVVEGDERTIDWDEFPRRDFHTVLALTGSDERNYALVKKAVSSGVDQVMALVNEATKVAPFKELGVRTFVPAMFRATLIALMVRNPDIFTLLTSTSDHRDIREVYLRNPVLAKRTISEVVLPGDSLILAIGRDGSVLIPHGSTRLELGDRLTILGELEALVNVKTLMEG